MRHGGVRLREELQDGMPSGAYLNGRELSKTPFVHGYSHAVFSAFSA